ncbi:hypothetical protein GCM10007874_39900 [Labrys miyagiensis]|uniref:Uncharacterized protein n=1 Tax=Labrys miyagiensis TaxID=346912 RepID=A0ABQ6CKW1_9HYPH|nr:hypothetical protein GCM10007874_39900 [Labrys miyagiensis]
MALPNILASVSGIVANHPRRTSVSLQEVGREQTEGTRQQESAGAPGRATAIWGSVSFRATLILQPKWCVIFVTTAADFANPISRQARL